MTYRKRHTSHAIRRLKPKRHFWKRRGFWVSLAVLLIMGFVGYFIFFFKPLQIRTITVSGNQKVSASDIQMFANEEISRPLFGIPGMQMKNMMLIGTKNLKSGLLKHFPALETVVVTKKYPATLAISVQERIPVAAWCTNQNNCFLLDVQGIAFQPVTAVPGGYFIVRQDTAADQSAAQNQRFVGAATLQSMLEVSDDLSQRFHIYVQEIDIDDPLKAVVKTSEPWQLYVNFNEDISNQLTKLNALLAQTISPSQQASLQYIDVRFADKAYYQ